MIICLHCLLTIDKHVAHCSIILWADTIGSLWPAHFERWAAFIAIVVDNLLWLNLKHLPKEHRLLKYLNFQAHIGYDHLVLLLLFVVLFKFYQFKLFNILFKVYVSFKHILSQFNNTFICLKSLILCFLDVGISLTGKNEISALVHWWHSSLSNRFWPLVDSDEVQKVNHLHEN